jgi:hypothetical protein
MMVGVNLRLFIKSKEVNTTNPYIFFMCGGGRESGKWKEEKSAAVNGLSPARNGV